MTRECPVCRPALNSALRKPPLEFARDAVLAPSARFRIMRRHPPRITAPGARLKALPYATRPRTPIPGHIRHAHCRVPAARPDHVSSYGATPLLIDRERARACSRPAARPFQPGAGAPVTWLRRVMKGRGAARDVQRRRCRGLYGLDAVNVRRESEGRWRAHRR